MMLGLLRGVLFPLLVPRWPSWPVSVCGAIGGPSEGHPSLCPLLSTHLHLRISEATSEHAWQRTHPGAHSSPPMPEHMVLPSAQVGDWMPPQTLAPPPAALHPAIPTVTASPVQMSQRVTLGCQHVSTVNSCLVLSPSALRFPAVVFLSPGGRDLGTLHGQFLNQSLGYTF